MADVVICYAGADSATAARMAGAVSAKGYRLWSEEALASDGVANVADRVGQARAAIVIWSEAAAASDWVKAEANFARGQRKLIQCSADGRPPPLPFDPADVISLAGWRGEEAHPGWRSVAARLEALCGPAPAATARSRPAAAPSRRAAPVAPAPARRRGGGGLTALIALALIAVAAAGSYLWMRSQGPLTPQPRVAAAPAPTAGRARSPAQSVRPQAEPVQPSAVGATEPTASEAPEPEPFVGEEGEALTRAPPEPAPTRTAPQRRPGEARINRRNSENMRRFCERAGRGTPQCRAFRRLLREQRR